MSVWKPIATAASCTALLGLVTGMKIPTEMALPEEPEWRHAVEQTFIAGSDDRPLYEAGPEDLTVPRFDPMEQRVAYDAMENMNERAAISGAIDAGPIPRERELVAEPREIMPVALTQDDIAPVRQLAVSDRARAIPIVRVVSGTRNENATLEHAAATVAQTPSALSPAEATSIPQT